MRDKKICKNFWNSFLALAVSCQIYLGCVKVNTFFLAEYCQFTTTNNLFLTKKVIRIVSIFPIFVKLLKLFSRKFCFNNELTWRFFLVGKSDWSDFSQRVALLNFLVFKNSGVNRYWLLIPSQKSILIKS